VESERYEILISLSDIFRGIGQRRSDIYSPYKIPTKIARTILKYETIFSGCLEAKDVGLKLRKEVTVINNSTNSNTSTNNSNTNGSNNTITQAIMYYVDFELHHPLYLYQRLSETCVVFDAEN